jgi:hypothetical protein
MGELKDKWTTAKNKLNDQQKARLPKYDFGEKCDTFQSDYDKALAALAEANTALYNAYAEGTKPKAESARDLLQRIMVFTGDKQNKDILNVIGKDLNPLDALIVGRMRKLLKTYDDIGKSLGDARASVSS